MKILKENLDEYAFAGAPGRTVGEQVILGMAGRSNLLLFQARAYNTCEYMVDIQKGRTTIDVGRKIIH